MVLQLLGFNIIVILLEKLLIINLFVIIVSNAFRILDIIPYIKKYHDS